MKGEGCSRNRTSRTKKIVACLRDAYGLPIVAVAFLPIGNDVNTAVYRAVADDGTPYFLKLRSGPFDAALVTIPHFLRNQGIAAVITPLETRTGELWARVDQYAVILSPYVAGRNGRDAPLSEDQWIAFGRALKGLHAVEIPPSLAQGIPRETYAPYWCARVREFQQRAEETDTPFVDAVAAELAALLREKRAVIDALVERTEELGSVLRNRSLPYVLCHADIHAVNVLIDDASGALYVVDWDTLIFAPKERDLMFIGAGIASVWKTAEEEASFYRGYGPAEIDRTALVYYRYVRIVEDIASYSQELLLTGAGGADRARGLQNVRNQFLPNHVVEIAFRSDTLRAE